MRFLVGLLFFWITIISIKLFLEEKTKINNSFSLPISFTFIGILEFVFGILNIMKIGSIIIVLLAILHLIKLIINNKIKLSNIKKWYKNPTNILISLIFIYITIICKNMHLMHYDDFSHWGLIVKSLFENNRLPNFQEAYILFKGYQPGSACFIYFFGLLCGKTEGNMIIAQNYLIFSFFTILLKQNNKNEYLKMILVVSSYIFMFTTSKIMFNNLLVDNLIAIMFIGALIIVNYYKNNIKKAILYSLPIVAYLVMVKNIGLVLDGFICLYLLFICIKEKKIISGIKGISLVCLTILIIMLIWQGHVSMVYGQDALNSKHSLSITNIMNSVRGMGVQNIKEFIKIYINNFLTITKNEPNIFILLFNIIALALVPFQKKKEKYFNLIISLDVLYLAYFIILGIMYIFSMPWEEAKILAGYTRYMMTIVIVILGLYISHIIKEEIKGNKIIIVMLSAILLIPAFINNNYFKILLGHDNYENSDIAKADAITKQVKKDCKNYIVYAPSSKGDAGKMHYVMKYKLLTNNITIIQEKEKQKEVDKDSCLILYDEIDEE